MVVVPQRYEYEENYWENYMAQELVQEPVKKIKRKRKLRVLPITVIILSFVLINMGLAVKTASISMANIKLDGLNQQLKTLENEKSVLQLEVARLKSVDRIEMAARNNMRMIYANEAPSIRMQQSKSNYNSLEESQVQSQNKTELNQPKETWGRIFLNWLNEKINHNSTKGVQG